jgi:hypothetical protein
MEHNRLANGRFSTGSESRLCWITHYGEPQGNLLGPNENNGSGAYPNPLFFCSA